MSRVPDVTNKISESSAIPFSVAGLKRWRGEGGKKEGAEGGVRRVNGPPSVGGRSSETEPVRNQKREQSR